LLQFSTIVWASPGPYTLETCAIDWNPRTQRPPNFRSRASASLSPSILVMVLGGMAMANRMSWGWCLGAILGIAIGFGAPQIVTWVRGMFGV
jgi:hypothetical protein